MKRSIVRQLTIGVPKALKAHLSVVIALLLSSSAWSAHQGGALAPAAEAGDLDPTFGLGGKVTTDFGNFSAVVTALAIQRDSKIIAAGYMGTSNVFFGNNFALARYNANGTIDSSFGVGGKVVTDFFGDQDEIRDVAIQDDGKIVAAGRARSGASIFFGLARYNGDGSLDTTFGTGGKLITDFFGNGSDANALVIQSDGKIVVSGNIFTPSLEGRFGLARYNVDGSLDSTFGIAGKVDTTFFDGGQAVRALAIQPDGRIIAGGTAGHSTASLDVALARYNSDGSLDTSFGAGGKVSSDFQGIDDLLNDLAILPNGKILVAEDGFDANDRLFSGLLRYNPNGSADLTFGSGGKVIDLVSPMGFPGARLLAVQPNGKIVTNGLVTPGDFGLVRYNADGTLDPTFGIGGKVSTDFAGGNDQNLAIIIQDDWRIVTAGSSTLPSPNPDFALARYNGVNFDICLQDENNRTLIQFNSITGDYRFSSCNKGVNLSGAGKITTDSGVCKLTLKDSGPTPKRPDRNVLVQVNHCTRAATAFVQIVSTGSSFSITDADITNNSCACSPSGTQ